MYSKKLNFIDHYQNPKYNGTLPEATCFARQYNPTCGDFVEIYCIIEKNTLDNISFIGTGCVLSQAVSDMFCKTVKGKSIQELKCLNADFINNLTQLELGPNRVKCALLPLQALQLALTKYTD